LIERIGELVGIKIELTEMIVEIIDIIVERTE